MNQEVSNKPWFADGGGVFKGKEPFYFDTEEFPWVKEVESQWQVIRDELKAMLAEEQGVLVPYANKEMTSRPDQWKTFGMMFWTLKFKEKCAKCPKTWDILKNIPNMTAASFNLLEAQTTIKPHHGDTNAIIRCHMGLVVPAPAPRCGFRVGTETRSWEEGRFLMFCDAHEHTAWNNTDRKRYILVVDIMRPEFAGRAKSVSSRVLASINSAVLYQDKAWMKRLFGGRISRAGVFAFLQITAYIAMLLRIPGGKKW